MRNAFRRMTAAHKLREKNIRLTTLFSAFVLCLTIAALVLPAVALSKKEVIMDCPLAVHEHSESCYQIDENGDKILTCGQADYVVHTHDEACYDSEGNLICTLPEIQEHTHDESCYEEQQVLVCDLEENEDHTHTDECYKTEKKLICGKDELHTHNESCFDADGNLICDKIVLLSHQHDDECLKQVKQSEAETTEEQKTADTEPAQEDQNQDIESVPASDGQPEETAVANDPADEGKTDTSDENQIMIWEESTDKVTVHVEADPSAFPEGTSMQLRDVDDKDTIKTVKDTVEGEVQTVKAVDISFYDSSGKEIEPEKPIRVSMTIKQKDSEKKADLSIVHVDDEGKGEEVKKVEVDKKKKGKEATATFTAGEFSVYAVVYTVDFHYEVNGKMYEFSIPGGGFVSLEHVVEVLGIARIEENGESTTGNGAGSGSDSSEDGADSVSLNGVKVSDKTRKFVADVVSVEFSSPELVWVGKADEKTTVGKLKKANGLDVQYSAELTEEQIKEINSQTVEAGDWALISVQPFTSEESLTVAMGNGDQWTVKVTDAQKPYKDVDYLENGNYIIYRSDNSNSRYMFLKNDGTTSIKRPANGEALSASEFSDYTWSVTKNWNGTYTIKSTNSNRYISLTEGKKDYDKWSKTSGNSISVNLDGHDGITIAHNNYVLKRDDTGFYYDTGTGVGLTFYKIENNPSGGTSHDTGIELTDEERAELSKWEETIEKFNTLTDYNKTAEISDYDKRIYKVDLEADSGIMDFYKDVDLGFVLDVSNSMKFPSSLKAVDDNQQVWMTKEWLNWAKSTYSDYYNKQNCFYVLSDPALTSTIYRVFWNGSKWQYQDASSNDPSKIYDVNDGTTFKEPFRQSYTLYYADDQVQRMDYLNDSVAQAVATLKKIVQPTEGADDETANVRIAYNFFAGTKTKTVNNVTTITQYAIRGSHDFVDLRSQDSRTFEVKPKGNEADGTRQDLALYDSNSDPNLGANEFSWDTDTNVDRYVILVTDGAPNGASMSDVEAAARRLKSEDHVKLITIGLSTKDVDGGSTLLKTIADDVDGDGIKDFYEAEKASDLKHILSKILQTIMAKGLVRGKVTDTIDKGFYPVDAQGNPLAAGVYKNGNRIQNAQINDYVSGGKPTTGHQNEAFYTWEQVGDEWKITWYNQEIGWNDNDSTTGNPWKGTVYVKAKEDYLGGNLIETNDGNAQIEPTGLKLVINGTPEPNWRPLENMNKIDLPIPRVNVHNLETQENSTTWTVYRGTSVTPGDQIKALWNAIPIEEVVSSSVDSAHKITTGSGANIGTGEEGDGETFTLGSLMAEVAPSFNIDSLINQITAIKSSASQEFTYTGYGHESGKIMVKVERTVGNQTPATHTADTVGTPVEQYKVTFTYKPFSETERRAKLIQANELDDEGKNNNNYHNGSNGRGAEETGTLTSTNTHTINVFQKGIQVTKVDATNNDLTLPGAVFELFRVDTNGNANVSAYNLPSGSYTKVGGDLTANSNGIITINPVIPEKDTDVTDKTLYEPNINVGAEADTSHDTVFYLVEKTPPTRNGVTYAKMPGAIKFTMTLTEDKGNDSTATLYNWTQTAAISAQEHGNGTTVYLVDDATNTTTGTNVDVYAYKLKNGRATDITLIKVDKVTQNSIGGAKFRLQKGSENVDLTKLTITAISDGAVVNPENYDLNGTTIKIVTVPEGGIRIAGLTDDTYTLREVTAPAGYVITDSGKVFKTENGAIKNTDDTAHANEAGTISFEVENEPGAALPSTGGPGTNLFYLFGIMLAGLAGLGMMMKRRRKNAA